MTEGDAKRKWCPFSRYAYPDGATGNREPDNKYVHPFTLAATRCLGSGCMGWRWDVSACQKGPDVDEGYCGLAGKP
jgi:hypothetical protein